MAGESADDAALPWHLRYPGCYPENIDWQAELPARPLFSLFDDAALRYGDRPCVDFLDRKYRYAEIATMVARAASGLQRLGIGRGTKVGLFLPNTPYSVVFYFAVLKTGATVVNYNPLYAPRELAAQIDDSGTEWMVTLDLAVLYDKLAPLLGKSRLSRLILCRMPDILPFPKNLLFPLVRRKELAVFPDDDRHIPAGRLLAETAPFRPVDIDPERDIAVLQYTGGTTGTPKGAMLTHANLAINTQQCAYWFPARLGEEKVLGVLPFFHVFAMTVVLNLGIRLGAELILLPRFDLDQVMAVIDAKKPTMFPAVPTLYTAINSYRDRAKFDLRSIRYCISGGAPLPMEVKQAFEANTGCSLVEGYGLTEASPVVACNPLIGLNKAGSVGVPLPGTVIEIVDPASDRLLPQGERGEVCIRGPQVMAGYWQRPEESAHDLRGGRLHTGDMGYIDQQGYVFVVDRIKDLILCSGFNVYPRAVEEAIYLHPLVHECVALGVPDPYRGESVKAFVKPVEGASLTAEALLAFLADKLSPIEMPRFVEFRNELPRTMVGKLSRKDLADEERRRREEAA
ncbi:MAG: AMP-binding protein [Azospirillum sp.]|nr:AMP-binding protein [Azospirillum sp.]